MRELLLSKRGPNRPAPGPQSIDFPGIGPVRFERSARARRIVISIRAQRDVRVAVPRRTSMKSALEFVRAKQPWIRKQLAKIRENEVHNRALAEAFAATDRAAARRRLTDRLRQLADRHGFAYSRVILRRQQTRWGSCSRKNVISLNLKLVVLDGDLIDYVILHELAHTRVHDHSRKFWAELDKYVGSGKAMAARLRQFDTRWI